MANRSPLYEFQSRRGARFGEYHGWEIVEDYGAPLNEYEAVCHHAGAFDLSYLGKLRVSGRDRVRFLHNLVSNDIKNLKTGTGCYATLLTHQGRMESDLYVYAMESEFLLECSPAGRDRLFQSLNKYIVSDVVTVEDVSTEFCVLSIQGPRSREFLERSLGIPLEHVSLLGHRTIAGSSGPWTVVRRDRTGCDGYDLWLPFQDAPEVWRRWVEGNGVLPAGHLALDWLRTEAGIPWYGVDMDERNLPMEMGLTSAAISLTKGCYRGQEIVARVIYRGNLGRQLGAVAVDHAEPPARGAEVRAAGTKIGEVTSAIVSPRLQRPLALAVLKTDFLTAGTSVEVTYGTTAHPGKVVTVPLPQ
jgi:folate-binding protein YgfZ